MSVRSVPSARTVICTATVYNTDRPYSIESADGRRAEIARYAWGDDYHDVIGARLDELLRWMRASSPEPFDARGYVDTGPIQERVYAQYAGIGWIGKNTCVINPQLGSWIFLAEIICSLPLEVDAPALDQCGTCTLCLEACPTGALVSPGVLDSTRCISYLTIELRGDIPAEHRAGIGAHVYGCDICQEVCPWNAVAPRSTDPAWQPRAAWDRVDLLTLLRRSNGGAVLGAGGKPDASDESARFATEHRGRCSKCCHRARCHRAGIGAGIGAGISAGIGAGSAGSDTVSDPPADTLR